MQHLITEKYKITAVDVSIYGNSQVSLNLYFMGKFTQEHPDYIMVCW